MITALTYRMKAPDEVDQPLRHPGPLEFLIWLLLKLLPLIVSDMWPDDFLSRADSFKAGTMGLCQGELLGNPICPKMVA